MSHWIIQTRRAVKVIALVALALVPITLPARPAAAQSYQRVSARCRECGKSVPLNSQKGDTCPHCGVVWGVEDHRYVNGSNPSSAPTRARRRSAQPAAPAQEPVITRKACTGCGKSVSVRARVGESCPHCGAVWQFQNTYGETEGNNAPSSLMPLGPVQLASSVAALKTRRPAVLGQLPASVRWMDQRAERVIARLPQVAQEAYYLALEDYTTRDTRSQGQIAAALRLLSQLPAHQWPALAEDVSLAFNSGSASHLRRDPVGTLRQVGEMAAFLSTLE